MEDERTDRKNDPSAQEPSMTEVVSPQPTTNVLLIILLGLILLVPQVLLTTTRATADVVQWPVTKVRTKNPGAAELLNDERLIRPWDVWIHQPTGDKQGRVYHDRKDAKGVIPLYYKSEEAMEAKRYETSQPASTINTPTYDDRPIPPEEAGQRIDTIDSSTKGTIQRRAPRPGGNYPHVQWLVTKVRTNDSGATELFKDECLIRPWDVWIHRPGDARVGQRNSGSPAGQCWQKPGSIVVLSCNRVITPSASGEDLEDYRRQVSQLGGTRWHDDEYLGFRSKPRGSLPIDQDTSCLKLEAIPSLCIPMLDLDPSMPTIHRPKRCCDQAPPPSPGPMKRPANVKTLFDSSTMDAHHASIVLGTVTQDFDYARFEEEASTDDIAGESTWELLQLPLTWDVWLSHISIQTKRNAYSAQKDRTNREGAPSGLEHVTRERRRSSVAHDKPTTFQPRGFHHQVTCNAKLMVSRWFNVRRGSRTYPRRWRTVNQSMQRDAIQPRDRDVWLPTWIERDKRPANPTPSYITAICGLVVGLIPARCLSNCCSIETWYKGA